MRSSACPSTGTGFWWRRGSSGGSWSCWEGEGTTVSLARYFEEGHCLLDLEDAMDRAGLPYAYEAQRSGYVIFRPSGEELRLALDA